MSQTESRPVSRTAEFTHHYTAALVRLGRSFDLHNEPQLKINIQNTMKISTRLKTEDFSEFMATIGKQEIENPYLWQTAISRFISDKYPVPEKQPEPILDYRTIADESVALLLRATTHKFKIHDADKRELVWAVYQRIMNLKYGRPYINVSAKYIIKEAGAIKRKEAMHAIRKYNKMRDRL